MMIPYKKKKEEIKITYPVNELKRLLTNFLWSPGKDFMLDLAIHFALSITKPPNVFGEPHIDKIQRVLIRDLMQFPFIPLGNLLRWGTRVLGLTISSANFFTLAFE